MSKYYDRIRTIPEPTPKQIERFWSNVKILGPNDCWEWMLGTVNQYGMVGFWTNGKQNNFFTHRVSFSITYGPIPTGSLCLHSCDNPPCCNPEHLFLGTQKDNCKDRDLKGRSFGQAGEANNFSKLTNGEVLEIYRRGTSERKETLDAIAKDFKVARSVVSHICLGWSWKHVTGGVRRPDRKSGPKPKPVDSKSGASL